MGTFSYVASEELGRQICEVLELDATQVQKMRIELNAAGPAYVHVTMIMPDDHGKLAKVLRRYRLEALDGNGA
jgi:methyl coenzyme M reductase gamma subunit